jgi:hypothetical protein
MLVLGLILTAALNGTWQQACSHGYSREETFQGTSAVYTERNFWDLSCTQPSVEITSRGTITLGEAVTQPAGALKIDFIFDSVSFKPVDEKSAEAWRERGVCGFRDWQAGMEKVASGLECDFFGNGTFFQVPKPGDRKFGIVKIGEGALYFGRLSPERDGSSESKRPLDLDLSPYYFTSK